MSKYKGGKLRNPPHIVRHFQTKGGNSYKLACGRKMKAGTYTTIDQRQVTCKQCKTVLKHSGHVVQVYGRV